MGWPWVTWTGLRWRCTDRVSILYSGPIMLPHRQPGPIDWLEDQLSTGLLFVAVALLLDDLLGKTLTPQATRWPSGRAHCVRDEDHRGPPSRRWLQWIGPDAAEGEMGRDVRLTVWVDAKVKEIDRVQ
jgi:hypothetical protein